MRRLILMCLTLLTASPTAFGAGSELSASRVFELASPSIVIVHAHDKTGGVVELGSGVVVSERLVVSNCHVVANSAATTVLYKKKEFAATPLHRDLEHDLCSFSVEGLLAPPALIGNTANIKVGEAAFAIGSPEGLELTLSGGLISGLRHALGGVMLQVTTPISPGSSGGGLFDSQGHLIGVTSYYMKQGQQLNFALPVEWIKELPQHEASINKLGNGVVDARPPAKARGTVFKCEAPNGEALYVTTVIPGQRCAALFNYKSPLASDGGEAVHVSRVDLGTAVDVSQRITSPTEVFASNDTIHVSVLTNGSTSKSVPLRAKFTYQDGQTVNTSSQNISPRGIATTAFYISKPDGWPAGEYQVQIYLYDRLVADRKFRVE